MAVPPPRPMDTSKFKVTKLSPNGPKPGQSTEAWLRGKQRDADRTRKILEQRQFNGKRASK